MKAAGNAPSDGGEAAEGDDGSSSASAKPPQWAERMKRGSTINHGVSVAAHTVRSGDHGGGSMSVNLNQDDRK